MKEIDLHFRLRSIEQLLAQWRPRLHWLGLGGLVEQLLALLRDMIAEIDSMRDALDARHSRDAVNDRRD